MHSHIGNASYPNFRHRIARGSGEGVGYAMLNPSLNHPPRLAIILAQTLQGPFAALVKKHVPHCNIHDTLRLWIASIYTPQPRHGTHSLPSRLLRRSSNPAILFLTLSPTWLFCTFHSLSFNCQSLSGLPFFFFDNTYFIVFFFFFFPCF